MLSNVPAPADAASSTALTSRDIRTYARILLRYAPLIIGITAVTVAVAGVYSFMAEKIYEAQVTMRIERNMPGVLPMFENVAYTDNRDLDYFQTQIKLFYSRTLIKEVLLALDTKDQSFMRGSTKSTDEQANLFLKKITVRAEPRTQLVRVIVEDRDPLRAQVFANVLADQYITHAASKHMDVAKHYRDWFGERLVVQEQEVLDRERSLRAFDLSNQFDAAEYEILKLRLRYDQEKLSSLLSKGSDNLSDQEKEDYDKRITDLEHAVTQQLARVATMSSNELEHSLLDQKLQTARRKFEQLLKAQDDSNLFTTQFDPKTISVVDYATVPQRPSKPQKTVNLMLGLLFGLLLGSCISFFAEYLDDTIKSPSDIESFLRMPFLGLIPALTRNVSTTPIENIVENEPKGTIAEAYRAIRTNILFSSDRKISRIVVTSAGPGEGKTTTAVNLAHVMARAGDRTLLLDGDMRRPRIHKIFGVDSAKMGLSSYLVGEARLEDIIFPTQVPMLSILPAGIVPPNPVELLNSPRLAELFERLGAMFDRVIIDTPPVIAVTDPAIMSRMADAVILTVHGGRAHRDVVKRGIETLTNVGGQVMGIILNNVNIYRASYYDYYYYSYYRYAYGYRYGYYAYGQSDEKKKRRKKRSSPSSSTPKPTAEL